MADVSKIKLKAENLKLKRDLITLSTNPESIEAMQIQKTWAIHKMTEDALWHGQSRDVVLITDRKEVFDGFVKAYEKIALGGS